MAKASILIYGANGFTAKLMLNKLSSLNTEIVLAGRNRHEITELASAHGFRTRIFDLDHPATIAKHVQDIGLVMNCAGPFRKTAIPLALACMTSKCHYFDITGELRVFQSLHSMHEQANVNKVCVIPGMGFDIVPSDCLSAMLAGRAVAPQRLMLAIITKNTQPSHGTLKTAFLESGFSILVSRKNGLEAAPKDSSIISVDVNGRSISCMRAPLADLFCATLSTGITHIDTYLALPKQMKYVFPLLRMVKILSQKPFFNRIFTKAIEKLPNGPSPSQLAEGHAYIVGEVLDSNNQIIRGILRTPEPYKYTGEALIKGAERWLSQGLPSGFHTPSKAFGEQFALEVNPSTTMHFSNG